MVRSLAMSADKVAGLGARFWKLWAASTTSALGSGLATIATPLFVASRTSDPLIISAAFGVAWLPWLLFALPGGVLVDKVERANGLLVGGDTVMQDMVAGPLGGFLFALAAGLPFLANAGTYAAIAILI